MTHQPILFNINEVTVCKLLIIVRTLNTPFSLGGIMPICPECETLLDFEADEVEEGDVVVCDECGTEFEVITTDPLEIVKVDEDYEDEGALSAEEEEEE